MALTQHDNALLADPTEVEAKMQKPWVQGASGLFMVILAVMLPIELTDVGQAPKRLKPTALAVLINFVVIPLIS